MIQCLLPWISPTPPVPSIAPYDGRSVGSRGLPAMDPPAPVVAVTNQPRPCSVLLLPQTKVRAPGKRLPGETEAESAVKRARILGPTAPPQDRSHESTVQVPDGTLLPCPLLLLPPDAAASLTKQLKGLDARPTPTDSLPAEDSRADVLRIAGSLSPYLVSSLPSDHTSPMLFRGKHISVSVAFHPAGSVANYRLRSHHAFATLSGNLQITAVSFVLPVGWYSCCDLWS